ncbi:MAG: class I mannose-6-phosphate isomerase [Clostridia bacterium]|nr:class I mannose-6-phosphate isomerase [Clostridia bacterium]
MYFNYPMFFEKNRVFRVYTGGKLFADFFSDDSKESNYPEEWVVSSVRALNEGSTDIHEGISKIEGTEIYLDEAVKEHKAELLGDREDIGILTKILNSSIRLPVQAHPDKKFSKQYFNSCYGKEESWIILGTEPGAKVFYGFKDGVTMEQFSNAIDESENSKTVMEDLLVGYDVKVGDIIYIPAKMVHAIGAGCLLLEVQEPTDFTVQPEHWCGDYRLSDKEMYLGLTKKQALECFEIDKKYPIPLSSKALDSSDGVEYLSVIDDSITDSFRVRMINFSGGSFTMDKGACIYVVIDGTGKISGNEYEREIKKGDYFFIPEAAKDLFTISSDNMSVAECFR